ncbi:segregation/condensation protein A [Streptomyces sp. NPDC053755]|uniref:segregation/condensation protein A n=1 Tax=Streptomyces sp. NPDC053755 TaxID=3155815 RepID=UPI003437CCEA
MPPPPAESSRPPRRTLGRGPGAAPSGPEPSLPADPPRGGHAPGEEAPDPGGSGGEALSGVGRETTPAHAEAPAPETAPPADTGHAQAAGPTADAPGPAPAAQTSEAPVAGVPTPEGPVAEAPASEGTCASTPERSRAVFPEGTPGAFPEGTRGVSAPERPGVGESEGSGASSPEGACPSSPQAPAGALPEDGRFTVRLENFEGPFDLLLQLISKHKLDVTEVALSKVTDEFMAHIRAMGADWDLDQTTEFLVVAATLLDLKAARLLPAAEVEDEADLALLEARDLLFARLLQYRAYKRIAEILAERWEAEGRRYPRTVGLEPHHAALLPEVVISLGPEGFARLAVKAMQPKAKPQVYVDHIHAPLVNVRDQARIVVALLRERGTASFRELAAGAPDTLTVVARFLALLELYRDRSVGLDQDDALGELTVSWTGGDGETRVTDEFDQESDHETEARA